MKYFFTILVIAFLDSPLFAQKFSVSANFQLAIPQDDFKEINPDAGYGLRANFFYRPLKEVPVKIGIELGIQEKAGATRYFYGTYLGYYDQFRESATSNVFSLMWLARIQSSQEHKVKPFLDIIAGWNSFYSTVTVEDISYYSYYNYSSPSYSKSTKANWAFAYGLAGGIDIPLNRRDGLGLELKIAYMAGSYTKYLTNPTIGPGGDVLFQENSSRTNMLIPQAGIRITIR